MHIILAFIDYDFKYDMLTIMVIVPNPKLRSLNGAVIWVQLHALLRSHSFALVANNFTRKTIYSQMASFCGLNFIVIKYLLIGSVQEQMCTCFDNIQHR